MSRADPPAGSGDDERAPGLPAIVLAAGASSRMGAPKALLDIDGRPALRRVIDTLHAAGIDDVTVVIGRHAAEIVAALDLADVRVLHHAGWAAGRTSSIRCALGALAPGAAGALLALTDMPWVRAETIVALRRAFASDPHAEVVVPLHDGAAGHPIVLRDTLLPAVLALEDDAPLRRLLRSRRRRVVHVSDLGVVTDVDTPDDLARARATLGDR